MQKMALVHHKSQEMNGKRIAKENGVENPTQDLVHDWEKGKLIMSGPVSYQTYKCTLYAKSDLGYNFGPNEILQPMSSLFC